MANGLITKNTDLKSLKYGSMPLGSDKPYVTKNIGQAPASQIGSQISHRIDDVSRIAQMLVGKPGIKYLLHEAELQQVNVGQRIKKAQQGGKSLVGAVLGQVGSTAVTTAKIVGSTLAQVPVNGTGTHFLRAFRTDTYLQPSGGNNASAFAQFFGAGGVEGAPLALQGKPINGVAKETNFGTEKNGNFTVDSKINKEYGYDSRVYNGKDLKDYDEVKNKAIPEDRYIGKFSSKLGKTITIDTSSLGPKDPLAKTKLQQSKAGSKEIGTINLLESGAPSALGGKPLFDYKNTATGTSTEDTIRNAQVGAPIKVTTSGSVQKDTTVTSTTRDSLIQSTSNQNVAGTLTTDELRNKSTPYVNTETGSYLGFTTEQNIGSVLTGQPIYDSKPFNSILIKSTRYDSEPGAEGYQYKKSLSNLQDEEVQSQNNAPAGTTYDPKNTYTQQQADRKVNPNNPDGKNVIKEKRVGLGDQGKTSKANVPYWTPAKPLELDEVNMLDIGDRQDAAGNARDMAKFYFEIITPDESKFLYFRAFIKSLDDGYSADWQARKYNGRAENFYTYGGFDRDINVSFTIAAATRNEMKPLYKKMVYLASATAPTYGASGLMRGTLARMTVGSYLDQIPGVITSVKFTVDNNVPWEIAMGQPEGVETDVQVLPMVMECTISFKPIHDFAPQTGLKHYFTNSHEGVKFF